MKLFLIFLLQIIFSFHLFGQIMSGEIIYEVKENMHRDLPPEAEMYKHKIPEFRTHKNKLLFTKEVSLYTRLIEEKKDNEEMGNGRGMRRRGFSKRGNAEHKIFVDLANDLYIEEKGLLGKKFLIEGAKSDIKWKMTADQKQVGKFLCQKAVYQDSTQITEVWFTPMIPIPNGPAEYRKLPGMILHVDINEGQKTITAIDIIDRPIEKDEISKPTEGKQITHKDFEELREEKMKEMKSKRGHRRGRGRR